VIFFLLFAGLDRSACRIKRGRRARLPALLIEDASSDLAVLKGGRRTRGEKSRHYDFVRLRKSVEEDEAVLDVRDTHTGVCEFDASLI